MANVNDHLTVVRFRKEVLPDEAKSREENRPVFKELEVIEFRFAGNTQTVAVYPAHDPDPNATRERGEPVTYAQVHASQYRKFKALEEQDVKGTPLSELTFLTESRRKELRAVNIHTAEALAGVGGQNLKKLGPNGSKDKASAAAYLEKAAGSADVTSMAATIEELKQRIADQDAMIRQMGDVRPVPQPQPEPEPEPEEEEVKAIDEFTDDELKQFIKENGGEIRGNLSRETLIERATELASQK